MKGVHVRIVPGAPPRFMPPPVAGASAYRMAVGASDVAFIHLCSDGVQGEPVGREDRNLSALLCRITAIELKDAGVRASAVRTRCG